MEQQQKIVGCTCLDLFAVQTEHEWKNVYLWILNHEVNFTSKLCCNWKEVVTADRTDLFYCHKVLFLGIIFCVCVYAYGQMNWIKPQEGLSFPVPLRPVYGCCNLDSFSSLRGQEMWSLKLRL